jgi:16S rRNA (cytidine1402-2'-O)-methyltransferase
MADIAAERRTTVLYEAPHRVARTVHDLAAACGPERRIALARELTKLHEELWRGPLVEAVDHVAAIEPRGEYVLVVDGAPPPGPVDDDAIRAALVERLGDGDDRRTAVATVTAALGVAKRRVYEIATALPRS